LQEAPAGWTFRPLNGRWSGLDDEQAPSTSASATTQQVKQQGVTQGPRTVAGTATGQEGRVSAGHVQVLGQQVLGTSTSSTTGRENPVAAGQVPQEPQQAPQVEVNLARVPEGQEEAMEEVQSEPRTGLGGTLAGWVRDRFEGVEEYLKLSTFLAFPGDSLFCDPCIEELYQRHRMQQWSPRLDWSVMALLQMLLWDVAANPSYRLGLVLRFYGAFLAMVLLHKLMFVVARERPQPWRKSRGVLLCSFLLGRGVVCHPLLTGALRTDASMEPAREAAQSGVVVIGLGMTNLSAVLALQLGTLDTLLLCVVHGLACACWAGLTFQITSGDAWYTFVAGHLLLACVCVWQQHEQERFDRYSFEQELLMERGTLLHSSDCLVRQGTQVDFNMAMQVLYKARSSEHLNL